MRQEKTPNTFLGLWHTERSLIAFCVPQTEEKAYACCPFKTQAKVKVNYQIINFSDFQIRTWTYN